MLDNFLHLPMYVRAVQVAPTIRRGNLTHSHCVMQIEQKSHLAGSTEMSVNYTFHGYLNIIDVNQRCR